MAARQYIGARYVPIFDGDWDNTKEYEPLVIVSNLGNSYTSRTFVPAGVDISNTEYWALTGNYNAQVEAYRQEVSDLTEDVTSLENSIRVVNIKDFGAIGDGVTDDSVAFGNAITEAKSKHLPVYIPAGTFIINSTFDCKNVSIIGDRPNTSVLKFTNGHLLIGGFNYSYTGFTVELAANNIDAYAIEAFYLTQCALLSELKTVNGGISITKSWYFVANNIVIQDGNKGTGLYLYGTTDEGGVNCVNFTGLFIHDCANAIVIDGTNYSCQSNVFNNVTAESISDTAIMVAGNASNNSINGLYIEGVTNTSDYIIVNNQQFNVLTMNSVMIRTNVANSKSLFHGNVYVVDLVCSATAYSVCDDDKTLCIRANNVLNALTVASTLIDTVTVTPFASGLISLGSKPGYELINAFNQDGYSITNKYKYQDTYFGYAMHAGVIDTSQTERTYTCVWIKVNN